MLQTTGLVFAIFLAVVICAPISNSPRPDQDQDAGATREILLVVLPSEATQISTMTNICTIVLISILCMFSFSLHI